MNTLFTKILIIIAIVVIIGAIGYVVWFKNMQSGNPQSGTSDLLYDNAQYGFWIPLPETWRGYTVSIDKWTGNAFGDEKGDVGVADGPVVSIHNPKWTKELMYQDIPIMVFTLDQWNALKEEQFHIGAAPIDPSELGRNAKYVFALPARYNFAFPPGYEEVEQILEGKPLHAY